MRAHAPTLVVFSILSLAIVAAGRVGPSTAAPRQDASPTGEIAGVATIVDGDSLKINGISVRLHGIDAPEMSQHCAAQPTPIATGHAGSGERAGDPGTGTWSCGLAARRALAHMIGHAEVQCAPTTLDKYGRTVARCAIATKLGRLDLNGEMVRQGLAWAFVRYSSDYVGLEREAQAARRGIWQAQTQTAWDYRASKWQAAEAVAPDGCTIKGNVTVEGERIYHLPWSPWYTNVRMDAGAMERKGKRWFCSEAEAEAAGWRPSAAR